MPNYNSALSTLPVAIANAQPTNPTAPASTSAFKLQGLAALITPQTPQANILALISATLTDSATTVGEGINVQIAYGPVVSGVAPPANGAALPAGAVLLGPVRAFATGVTLTTAADLFNPITLHGVAKGLTPGQQYWFDVYAESIIGASVVALTNVQVDLVEIA